VGGRQAEVPPGRDLLSTRDVTSLIVGVIVGVGIFQTMPEVARGAGSWWGTLLLWLGGGLVSLCGALGYAELASSCNRPGGDYAYLTEAYGPRAGFLFGWLQTTVVRPGDIAVMAFAFATYGRAGLGLEHLDPRLPACLAVVASTLVNICGVREGVRLQNLLTAAKVAGLLIMAGVAFWAWGRGPVLPLVHEPLPIMPLQVALILVLFTYGGWNEAAYVAAEMKDPRRNVVRALLLGTGLVTVLYLLLNTAFLGSLGFAGVAASPAVAVDAMASAQGLDAARSAVGKVIGLLVAVSALGAVNGLIFAGARITDAVAADHAVFHLLARRTGQGAGPPVRALVWQGIMAVVLIVVLGSFVDTIMYTAAAVYAFYLATSVAVLVQRRRNRILPGSFRMPLYPWPTLVFCGVCLFLIHGAIMYRPWIALAALTLILAGFPVHHLAARRARRTRGSDGPGNEKAALPGERRHLT
jgi:APA family basic amino acid/polyamine antiporter